MPSVGTRVRLYDGQVGTITQVSASDSDDRVMLTNGEVRTVSAWDIAKVLAKGKCPECGYCVKLRKDGTIGGHLLYVAFQRRPEQCQGVGLLPSAAVPESSE